MLAPKQAHPTVSALSVCLVMTIKMVKLTDLSMASEAVPHRAQHHVDLATLDSRPNLEF